MSHTVEIEIGDFEYDVEATHFDPGQEPRGWDPGAGAEIDLGDTVKVWGQVSAPELPPGSGVMRPGVIKRISLDDFLDIYSEYREVPRSEALRVLEEHCVEYLIERMKEAYDDRDA